MTGRLLATHSPQRQGRRVSCNSFHSPDVAIGYGHFLPRRRGTCGHVRVGRGRIFISLRRQPGSNTAQDITESFGSVAPSVIGFVHVPNMEHPNAESVASNYANPRR